MDELIKKEIKNLILTKYILFEPLYQKVAYEIKINLDENFGMAWHCIVGKSFGFEVSFEANCLLYVRVNDQIGVLIWKADHS